jgi:hypothetical protein
MSDSRRGKIQTKTMVFRLSVKPEHGDCTAEALRTPSKEVLVKKFSDLCELGASVVNPFFTETRNNPKRRAVVCRFCRLAR